MKKAKRKRVYREESKKKPAETSVKQSKESFESTNTLRDFTDDEVVPVAKRTRLHGGKPKLFSAILNCYYQELSDKEIKQTLKKYDAKVGDNIMIAMEPEDSTAQIVGVYEVVEGPKSRKTPSVQPGDRFVCVQYISKLSEIIQKSGTRKTLDMGDDDLVITNHTDDIDVRCIMGKTGNLNINYEFVYDDGKQTGHLYKL
jgi:hypothetical protein